MAYTNGFDQVKVLDALKGRIGWRQQENIPALNSTNSESASGRKFQDFHPATDLITLKDTQVDREITDDAFNTFLEDLTKSLVMKCLTSVFNKVEAIDQILLFDRYLFNDQPIANAGNFVGVRFKPAGDYSIQINRITLMFDEAAEFNLYLFHDAKADPIWQQTVQSSANDAVEITPDDLPVLNRILNEYKSGYFYLGYFQDDIGSARALWEQSIRWNVAKCFGYQFVQARKTAVERFDKRNVAHTSQTFGLNMEVTSFRDHTAPIVRNAALFDNVIGLSMASYCIEQSIHSTRSNATERITKETANQLYIDNNQAFATQEAPVVPGLKSQINKEYKRLQETFFPTPKAQTVSIC